MSNETSTRKRLAVAGASVAIGLLLGATILAPNLAGAQETTTTTTTVEGADDRLADRQARIRSALDELVAGGTITAAQADSVAAELAGQWPGPGLRHWHHLHLGLDVASTAIGITEAELREALQGGETIAEVAEARGVSAQTVIDALVAAINARVDEALSAGNVDEERAAEIKANAVERATEIVNKERPVREPDASNGA